MRSLVKLTKIIFIFTLACALSSSCVLSMNRSKTSRSKKNKSRKKSCKKRPHLKNTKRANSDSVIELERKPKVPSIVPPLDLSFLNYPKKTSDFIRLVKKNKTELVEKYLQTKGVLQKVRFAANELFGKAKAPFPLDSIDSINPDKHPARSMIIAFLSVIDLPYDQDKDNTGIFHAIARRGWYDPLMRALQRENFPFNKKSPCGETILHKAVLGGHLSIVWLLLEHASKKGLHAFIDEQDCFGNTALHLATATGNEQIRWVLRKLGAQENIKNDKGQIAADLASD